MALDAQFNAPERNAENSQRNSGPNVGNLIDLFKGAPLTRDSQTDTSKGFLPDFHIMDSSNSTGSQFKQSDSSAPLTGAESGGSGLKSFPGGDIRTGSVVPPGDKIGTVLPGDKIGTVLPGDNIDTSKVQTLPGDIISTGSGDKIGTVMPGDNISTGNVVPPGEDFGTVKSFPGGDIGTVDPQGGVKTGDLVGSGKLFPGGEQITDPAPPTNGGYPDSAAPLPWELGRSFAWEN